MTLLQTLLWKRMIRLIGDYRHGKIDLHSMVDQLEVVLETADLKDPELVKEWYAHWEPLEEFDQGSAHDLGVDPEGVHPLVEGMRDFLMEELRYWERMGSRRVRRPLGHHAVH